MSTLAGSLVGSKWLSAAKRIYTVTKTSRAHGKAVLTVESEDGHKRVLTPSGLHHLMRRMPDK